MVYVKFSESDKPKKHKNLNNMQIKTKNYEKLNLIKNIQRILQM